MARVIHQEFYRDPIMGLIGLHRIEFSGSVPATEALTFPPLTNAFTGARVVNQITSSTPAAATLADAITCSGAATATDTLTIGGIVYTMRAAVDVDAAFEVFIGSTAATCAANLIKAINGVVEAGVVGPGTPPNSMVYATEGTTNAKITLTARQPGATGNIAITEALTAGTVLTPLAGGSGLSITAYVTSASTGAVTFNGMVAGDVIDLVTYHGNASVNSTATA